VRFTVKKRIAQDHSDRSFVILLPRSRAHVQLTRRFSRTLKRLDADRFHALWVVRNAALSNRIHPNSPPAFPTVLGGEIVSFFSLADTMNTKPLRLTSVRRRLASPSSSVSRLLARELRGGTDHVVDSLKDRRAEPFFPSGRVTRL